jgi:ribosomal protein S18 acetylase RimI-like enzyme
MAAPLQWERELRGADWPALTELYRIAPLGDKPPELLRKVFSNSMYRWFVYGGDRLVAAGRALADGADCCYICDVAVHPEHQGRQLGRAMMQRLMDDAQGYNKVLLYASPGKEGFYRKLGFRPMNTAMAIFARADRALATGLVREG